jgi:threonine dehydrogenase-like Zn-dependent dehydrogenase
VQALVFTALKQVELQDVAEPTAGADEVVVHVAACGICGSDLHGILHPSIRVPPLVMGHEFAGTTDDGRRVVVNPLISCGACDLCDLGSPELCRNRSIIGIHRAGGYASSVVVPESQVYELPAGLPFSKAALVEPLANAIHAWRVAGVPAPRRVGILGAGTIGLVCLLVSKAFGDAEVHVADLAPERCAVAERLGADVVGTALEGEYDVVFDAVGATATRRRSLEVLRPGGTSVWLGLLDDATPVDGLDLVRGEKRVIGSFCYSDADFREAIALCASVDDSWVTTVPLADSAETFLELMNGRTDIAKAVIVP